MFNDPNFSYKVCGDILLIRDLFDWQNPTMSVTNGAERVLEKIKGDIGTLPENIVYEDTDGIWDQMIVKENGDVNFAPMTDVQENFVLLAKQNNSLNF